MSKIVIRYGACRNEIVLNGTTYDMNALDRQTASVVRRAVVKAFERGSK
jgi:alpha-D-ribose 1-methylphosphonate 5-phosphate C-P lyase